MGVSGPLMRGQLARLDDYWIVVVSTDSLAGVLPTCWGLLATTDPGPLHPPLIIPLSAGSAGDHPDLWIRTTQIRTVTTAALTPVGPVPANTIDQTDSLLVRLLDVKKDN